MTAIHHSVVVRLSRSILVPARCSPTATDRPSAMLRPSVRPYTKLTRGLAMVHAATPASVRRTRPRPPDVLPLIAAAPHRHVIDKEKYL